MSNNDKFLNVSRKIMERLDESYQIDQEVSKYIEGHRHALVLCSNALDEKAEELDDYVHKIHELELRVKELEEMITTIW